MDILVFGERKGVRGERPLFAARCDRMAAARPCPLRRRKLRASTAGMRPNGGRKAVPVTTQEVTGIDSRDATEWRPQGRARCDAGSYGHRQQGCDRMAAARPCPLRRRKLRASTAGMRPDGGRKAVPVATQEVTGIDSRDATGWRPQGRARCDAGSYGHRQQGCDRMAAARPCPLRRRKLRASTAGRPPDGGRKAVPVTHVGSYARRQQSERGISFSI